MQEYANPQFARAVHVGNITTQKTMLVGTFINLELVLVEEFPAKQWNMDERGLFVLPAGSFWILLGICVFNMDVKGVTKAYSLHNLVTLQKQMHEQESQCHLQVTQPPSGRFTLSHPSRPITKRITVVSQ